MSGASKRGASCALLVAILTGGAGCGSDSPSAPSPMPAVRVVASPDIAVLAPGDTARFDVVVTDLAGAPVTRAVQWTSDAEGIATVDASGLVTGVSAGDVRIRLRAGSDTTSVGVTVTRAPQSIMVGGDGAVVPGMMFRLPVTVRAADGAPIPEIIVRWTTSDSSVATVDQTGMLRVHWTGDAIITATAGGVSSALAVTSRLVRLGDAGAWAALDGGSNFACALSTGGEPYCWGEEFNGRTGSNTDSWVPQRVPGDNRFVSIHAGYSHSCGLAADSTAWCWGPSRHGQLGNSNWLSPEIRLAPYQQESQRRWAWITVGGHGGNCGLSPVDSLLHCWGHNDLAQLGLPVRARPSQRYPGGTSDIFEPLVAFHGMKARAASVDDRHGCMLTLDGEAWCSGSTASYPGVQGDPASADSTPWRVVGGHRYSQLGTGERFTCGLRTDGVALCWGDNFGTPPNLLEVPTPVSTTLRFDTLRVAAYGGCGRAGDDWHCWGAAIPAQWYSPTWSYSYDPVLVRGPAPWRTVEPSGSFVCGLTTDGSIYCWGGSFSLPPLPAVPLARASTAATQSSLPRPSDVLHLDWSVQR